MSQEISVQEDAYISLNAPNYDKWLDYFLGNKKEAIREMTREMAAAKNPSYKMIDRFIWALLEYEEKDMPFILEIFKKYMSPYRGNRDYNKFI